MNSEFRFAKIKHDFMICTLLDGKRIALNYIDHTGTCKYVMLADDRKKPGSVQDIIDDIRGREWSSAELWRLLKTYAKDSMYGNDEWHSMGDIEECAMEVVELVSVQRDAADGYGMTFTTLCLNDDS